MVVDVCYGRGRGISRKQDGRSPGIAQGDITRYRHRYIYIYAYVFLLAQETHTGLRVCATVEDFVVRFFLEGRG